MSAVTGGAGLQRVMTSTPARGTPAPGRSPPVCMGLPGAQGRATAAKLSTGIASTIRASLMGGMSGLPCGPPAGTCSGPAPALPSSLALCLSRLVGSRQDIPTGLSRGPHSSGQRWQQGEASKAPAQGPWGKTRAVDHSPGGAAGVSPAVTCVTGYIICPAYPGTKDQKPCPVPHALAAVPHTYATVFQSTSV